MILIYRSKFLKIDMSDDQLSLNFNSDSESSQQFFVCKRSWSASKHRIILKYLQAHCYNLGGNKNFQSEHINYVDGFAGEGSYDEGLGMEDFIRKSSFWNRYNINVFDTDGSPLIALKCARIFREEDRVNLRCFFAEEKKETNQKLRKNCEEIGMGLDYKIYEPKAFSEILSQIMPELDGYPTLFFLDSFGVKGLSFEQICQIGDYVSKYKGELFLLLHNRAIARSAGFLTPKSDSERIKKTAESYMKNLTRLLGSNSDKDWQPKWYELRTRPQHFERWALQYFVNRVYNESKFKGVASYEIKEKYNDARPQYSIVVCSNHPRKAFGDLLNDIFAAENNYLFYEEDKSGLNQKFLDQEWSRQVEKRKIDVRTEIINILENRKKEWIPLEETITNVILELGQQGYDLGYLKRADYRALFITLFKQGIIEAESVGKKGEPTLKDRIRIVQ